MSTHPEVLGKIVPSKSGVAPMTAGRLPASACGGADPGPLGKIVPSNSGIVPMTAGHPPV